VVTSPHRVFGCKCDVSRKRVRRDGVGRRVLDAGQKKMERRCREKRLDKRDSMLNHEAQVPENGRMMHGRPTERLYSIVKYNNIVLRFLH